MKKVGVAAGVVVALLVAGLFIARSQVAAYYKTPEFQTEIKRLVGADAQATPRGWFDFTVTGKGLKVNVDVDAVPRIVTQKIGIRLTGTYGGGKIKVSMVVPLSVLLDEPPADWPGPDGEAVLDGLDACPWIAEEGGSAKCLSGKFSAKVTSPPMQASVKVGATTWRVEQPIKAALSTKPFTMELANKGKDLTLRQPVTVTTSVGAVTISGSIQPKLALEVVAKGMLARAAAATLLGCSSIPARDTFSVRGTVTRTQCQ